MVPHYKGHVGVFLPSGEPIKQTHLDLFTSDRPCFHCFYVISCWRDNFLLGTRVVQSCSSEGGPITLLCRTYVIINRRCPHVYRLAQGSAGFSVKTHIVNASGFTDHTVSSAVSRLCRCRAEVSTASSKQMDMAVYQCVCVYPASRLPSPGLQPQQELASVSVLFLYPVCLPDPQWSAPPRLLCSDT